MENGPDAFDEIYAALAANDPGQCDVDLTVDYYTAVRLGRSLLGNTVVSTLNLESYHDCDLTAAGTRDIERFIAFSPSLQEVTITGWEGVNGQRQAFENARAFVARVLHSLALNGNIQRLTLEPSRNTLSLRDCLNVLRDKLVMLQIDNPTNQHHFDNTVQDAQVVGTAIRSISTLESLKLGGMDHHYFFALMDQLALEGGPPNLRSLEVTAYSDSNWSTNPTRAAQAVQIMLDATTNLTEFKLWLEMDNEAVSIFTAMVFTSARNHPSIRKFSLCLWRDSVVYDGPSNFTLLLRNNNMLQHVKIGKYGMNYLLELLELLQTNMVLKQLEFEIKGQSDFGASAFMLEHERIGGLVSQLPGLQILKLTHDGVDSDDFIAGRVPVQFAGGFAKNESLTEIDIEWIRYDSDLRKELKFYAIRNEFKPLLNCPKPTMVETFRTLYRSHEEKCALSVVFHTLQNRNDWTERPPPAAVPPARPADEDDEDDEDDNDDDEEEDVDDDSASDAQEELGDSSVSSNSSVSRKRRKTTQ